MGKGDKKTKKGKIKKGTFGVRRPHKLKSAGAEAPKAKAEKKPAAKKATKAKPKAKEKEEK